MLASRTRTGRRFVLFFLVSALDAVASEASSNTAPNYSPHPPQHPAADERQPDRYDRLGPLTRSSLRQPQEAAQPLEVPDHARVDGILDANQIRRGVAKRLLFALFDFLAEQRVRQFSQTITLTGLS